MAIELRRTSRVPRPTAISLLALETEALARPSRRDRSQRSSPLAALPLELVHEIISYLDSASLLSLTLVSRSLRAMLVGTTASPVWKAARAREGLSSAMESWSAGGAMGEVALANLVWGRRCKSCYRSNARKVDFFLRVRLCATCWKTEIIFEGPDEPDPAFVNFFAGTKRYTPRNRTGRNWRNHRAFFYAPALASTSVFLDSLFPPSLLATVVPDLDMDDNLAVEEAHEHLLAHPPEEVQCKLDERAGWLKLVREDGAVLQQWDESRKKAEREEARERMRGRAGVA